MKTTLTEILKYNPSELIKQNLSLISTTDSIDFMTIFETVGVREAIWCLRVLDYKDYCLFLADVAESVLPLFEAEYPDDKRPRQAIDGIRAWHNGDIDKKQLYILSDAAFNAAGDAAFNAADAAADGAAADGAVFNVAYVADAACAADGAVNAGGIVYAGTYAVHAAINAGAGWEKIEELFIKHFEGDKQ